MTGPEAARLLAGACLDHPSLFFLAVNHRQLTCLHHVDTLRDAESDLIILLSPEAVKGQLAEQLVSPS